MVLCLNCIFVVFVLLVSWVWAVCGVSCSFDLWRCICLVCVWLACLFSFGLVVMG